MRRNITPQVRLRPWGAPINRYLHPPTCIFITWHRLDGFPWNLTLESLIEFWSKPKEIYWRVAFVLRVEVAGWGILARGVSEYEISSTIHRGQRSYLFNAPKLLSYVWISKHVCYDLCLAFISCCVFVSAANIFIRIYYQEVVKCKNWCHWMASILILIKAPEKFRISFLTRLLISF
jgi:hypothetical protein